MQNSDMDELVPQTVYTPFVGPGKDLSAVRIAMRTVFNAALLQTVQEALVSEAPEVNWTAARVRAAVRYYAIEKLR